MIKKSAGIVLYRLVETQLQVLLVHPGGPFFKNKDEGVWSIPKGEYLDGEDPLLAAQREFKEETGQMIEGDFIPLQPVRLKSGKVIIAWAVEGDANPAVHTSNLFEMEWPPRSGRMQSFPEVDRSAWFTTQQAALKLNPAQMGFIHQLTDLLTKQ
jgi:predicted NUDIX family NTP pyrophosphohydrolase